MSNMSNNQCPKAVKARDTGTISVEKHGYFWSFFHLVFFWTQQAARYVNSLHSRKSKAVWLQPEEPKATIDIVGREEAERRARKLLQVLGLPLLNVELFVEALNIDEAGSNEHLSIYGDSVQKILLTDTARDASSHFTGDLIKKSLLDFAASKSARTNAALCHRIQWSTNRHGQVKATQLYRSMYHLSLGPARGMYHVEWNRIGDTTEALIGAVYLASGLDWRRNCLDVMVKLGLDAPATWTKLWNDQQVPFRKAYGEGVWSEIEIIGRGAFFC